MARTRYAPDRGLTSRMLVTMFLLGLLYVVVLAAIFAFAPPSVWVLALLVAGGLLFAQYYFSDKLALFAMRGRIVTPEQAPEVHGAVDRICAMSNTPKPRVAIAVTDVPNAFATGRNQKNAVVCVTTGLLNRLDPTELEGVLAHEMAHIAHRDVAVMTIASFLGVVAGIITRFGLYFGMSGGMSRGRDNNAAVVFLVVLVASVVVYVISFMLTRALSRYRELSADRAAALLTARPSALGSALTKISGDMARIPQRDLRAAEPFNAFYFVPAFSKGFTISSLFSTHPPLDKRLEQLSQISGQLSRGA